MGIGRWGAMVWNRVRGIPSFQVPPLQHHKGGWPTMVGLLTVHAVRALVWGLPMAGTETR